MPLSAIELRNASPKSKPYKLYDEQGLFVLVHPNGSRYWRWKYKLDGKEKLEALGLYPAISLKDARAKRDELQLLVQRGVNLSHYRKAAKQAKSEATANTFKSIAIEWKGVKASRVSEKHLEKVMRRLEIDLFPWLGKMPITEIDAPVLLKCLRRVEDRGAIETAHRLLQASGEIFRYAIQTGRAVSDVPITLRGALKRPATKHHAAITNPTDFAALLKAIEGYQGNFVTKCALRLAPLVFLRPGELRFAEWSEFSFNDINNAHWEIPAARMKMKAPHIVPLPKQAVEILHELYALTGEGKYLFPSIRTTKRPMSDNTVLAALRRMGFEKEQMTGHGFRASARTILDEVLGVRVDLVEHQLAHAVRDANGRAYNRTTFLPERRKMMKQWADYLQNLIER